MGVGKGVRLIDLAVNNHDQVLEFVLARGNEELVFVAQLDIFRCAVQYTLQVDSQGEVCAVELHAVEHGAGGRRIFAQPIGCGYQTADCRDVLVQAVEARAEYSTLDLDCVLESRQDSGYVNRVAVHEPERAEVGIADRVYGLCAVVSAHHTYCIGVCLTAESSGEVQQAVQSLVRFNLVVHRPFDFAVDASECAVGVHDHYIAVLQTHIAVQHAVHQITVQVHLTEQLVLAEDTYGTQCTFLGHAASHVQCVHHIGEGGQLVGARCGYFAHDVDGYCARLTQTEHDLAALVTLADSVLQPAGSLDDR